MNMTPAKEARYNEELAKPEFSEAKMDEFGNLKIIKDDGKHVTITCYDRQGAFMYWYDATAWRKELK